MILNPEDYPPGFAEHAQPLLEARMRTVKGMSPHERLICKQILLAFPELGRGPMLDEIVQGAGIPEKDVTACLAHLDELDMLKYDEETGQVLVLYPLSSIPCPHRVHMRGKKPLYAM